MRFPIPHEMIEKAARRYEFEVGERRAQDRVLPQARVVTISRQFGAGGRQVALRLGQRLGWQVWDKEILDMLASQGGGELRHRMYEALDERMQGEIEALLSSLLGQSEKHTYFLLLPKAIFTIARNDAIILGRGAHILLPDALRVQLVASSENRIRNLMRLYDLSIADATREVEETDRERARFMRQFLKRVSAPPRKSGDPTFDLVINTDHYSFDQVAELIQYALARRYG